MRDKVFLDTNVLIYALAEDDPRAARAEELLADGGVISVQVLNEFVSVARRKLGMDWKQTREVLAAIRTLCPEPVPIRVSTHEAALAIGERHRCGFYDALIAAAAIEAKCSILYSEDFQHEQVLMRSLRVRNPFR